MKTLILSILVTMVCAITQAQVTDRDAEFVKAAADVGMLEVKLGQLAQTNGSSSQVRDLGKMMADDHGRANGELIAMANKKNITVSTSLSEKHQKKYNELAAKKGAEFDKEYSDCMVKDHKEAIQMFDNYSIQGDSKEIKKWASDKVPVLKHHLEVSKNTCKMIK